MAPQTNSTKAKTKAKASTAKAPVAPSSPAERARTVAQSAVDIPVGAVLEVTDRVTDLVEPFTDRSGAERQLRSYRTRLRRSVKRTERRGATARRRATTEARKTRNRVEREARKTRTRVEREARRRREDVRTAIEERTSRAQDLVDQVGEQLSSLR
jgi:hypothetical protein